ncbi:substrate-binding periplasmic protein [Pseudoalteromonas arabiensis]|uniref:substrate-binding periplasmic protein n=1 Tax=Pseudoalteromonas arabiensis TaxID=874454 RepID=UPI0007819302|nr:hypothetical protein [Pseudoalteromonas arabiensis]
MQTSVFTLAFLLCCQSALASVEMDNSTSSITSDNQTLRVVYPKTMPNLDEEVLYPLILLRSALEHSGVKFILTPSKHLLGQSRVLRQIEVGGEINVNWTMTTIEREQRLFPLRVPLFKGLYGWRLLLTTQSQLKQLEQLHTLDDLKTVYFVQGQDWPDTKILRDNGLVVSTSLDYTSLFNMLNKGRGQLFPRSILEVDIEKEMFENDMDLEVLPQLMLQYPSPIYFFFNKNNTDIADAVTKGIKIMRENGVFDRLFYKYNGAAINNASIHTKTIIELENKDLPPLTPVDDASLWLTIQTVNEK